MGVAEFWHRQPKLGVRVAFVGGPYDGFRQIARESEIREQVALPIERRIISSCAGDPIEGGYERTGIAIYELERCGETLRYLFVGRSSADCLGK